MTLNLVNFGNMINYSCFNNINDGSYIFDFGTRKVNALKYLMHSRYEGPNNTNQPGSWRLSGSNDNNTWKLIDGRDYGDSLNENGVSHIFSFKNYYDESFQFIKLENTGLCRGGKYYYFNLAGPEFFGDLIE